MCLLNVAHYGPIQFLELKLIIILVVSKKSPAYLIRLDGQNCLRIQRYISFKVPVIL